MASTVTPPSPSPRVSPHISGANFVGGFPVPTDLADRYLEWSLLACS